MHFFSNPPKPDSTIAQSETQNVKDFLQKSTYFNNMKLSASRISEPSEKKQCEEFIARIEKVVSYSDLKDALEPFDMKSTDCHPLQYMMGQNIMSAIMYTAGFFNETHNFSYYALQLFSETEAAFKSYHQVHAVAEKKC